MGANVQAPRDSEKDAERARGGVRIREMLAGSEAHGRTRTVNTCHGRRRATLFARSSVGLLVADGPQLTTTSTQQAATAINVSAESTARRHYPATNAHVLG